MPTKFTTRTLFLVVTISALCSLMVRTSDWIAALGPDEKVILLGHNLHLSKDNPRIRVNGYSMSRRNIGTQLARQYPGEVCVIWMLYDHGRHLDPYSKPYVKPVSSRPYEKLFGCPVLFNQPDSGLVIPTGVLQYPLAQSEKSLREFLRQAPYPLVKQEQPGRVQTTTQRIEQLLNQHNSMKLPNADSAAGQLNMSARTLHRKLAAEGTSFQALKDNFRTELAVQYVSRPELSFDAIATLMGFHDNSAFYRSFKKWTRVSPGQFRRELGAPGTDLA